MPLVATTKHLLDREAFARLKPGSYLINTARGPVVDENALVEALQSGKLAGAGLDVYEHEPVISSPLLTMPNVVLLPHIGSATLETRTAMALLAIENAIDVLQGKPARTPGAGSNVCLRVTVGTAEQNERLLRELHTVLRPG